MSDVRIRTNVGCIVDYCNGRLLNKDDSAEVRSVLRQILAHAHEIERVDRENRDTEFMDWLEVDRDRLHSFPFGCKVRTHIAGKISEAAR